MGTDKALLTYRGRTFLESILAMLREAGIEHVGIVLGHHAEEIRRTVNLAGAEVVINRDYQRGQTSSLQAGLKALDSPELEAIVLCLVDHPAVSAGVVRQLIARFQHSGAPVVIPTFAGQRGHPVLIGRALFEELQHLSPEEGANSIIRKHHDATQLVEVGEHGILHNADSPEDYRQLLAGED
jgi:molybdenum cofactor cytidylyltransferase